ncbi:Ltp family lipoprotein [Citricoccus parietis]|uniref:Ltp family lipoprotein n=1 Tax=Citricoccus parietis TaxID=592307 RepID=A0ABV5G7Y4_9MICC
MDRVTVDWNEQAAKSAANYLDYTSFSRAGLIDQLIFEGFTAEQAQYGVSQTGL